MNTRKEKAGSLLSYLYRASMGMMMRSVQLHLQGLLTNPSVHARLAIQPSHSVPSNHSIGLRHPQSLQILNTKIQAHKTLQ